MNLIKKKNKKPPLSPRMWLDFFVLHIKGMGVLFLLPIIIVYMFHPAYLLLTRFMEFGGFEKLYIKDALYGEIVYLFPPLSICWVYWCLNKYMDSDEKEIYYIYSKPKIKIILGFYKLYMIMILPIMVIYAIVFDIEIFLILYIFIASIIFFYVGIAYWITYFFGTSRIILPVFFGYSFIVSLPYSYDFDFMNYTFMAYGSLAERLSNTVLFFILGGLFWIMGYRLNIHYKL